MIRYNQRKMIIYKKKIIPQLYKNVKTDRRRETRQIAILTHNFSLCYHSRPIEHFCFSAGVAQPEAAEGNSPTPFGALLLTATGSDSRLYCPQLTQLEATQLQAAATNGAFSLTATVFYFHFHCHQLTQLPQAFSCYFITSICYCLDHVIFFRLFTQVHL